MNGTEKLLGFDARLMGTELITNWTQERRGLYLLRQDTELILSTDTLVWPSIFSREVLLSLEQTINSALFLWCDSQQLLSYLECGSNIVIQRPYWVIGITLVINSMSRSDQEMWEPFLSSTTPISLSPTWTFLGYDISDMGFLSGLSNCGYKTEERESLMERYVSSLNRYHLFSNLSDATKFRDLTNLRVSEQAPFFVYGLYQIYDCSSP